MRNSDLYFLGEGLSDLLPLDLLSGGNEPTLRCPLVGSEDDSLEHFHRLETGLLASSIALLQYESSHLRLLAQFVDFGFGVDALVTGGGEVMTEIRDVRDDDRDGLFGVGIGVDADVGDEVT